MKRKVVVVVVAAAVVVAAVVFLLLLLDLDLLPRPGLKNIAIAITIIMN